MTDVLHTYLAPTSKYVSVAQWGGGRSAERRTSNNVEVLDALYPGPGCFCPVLRWHEAWR